MLRSLVQRITRRASTGYTVFEELVEDEIRDQMALHMGCATGRPTLHLADMAKAIVGIDPDQDCIDKARAKAKKHDVDNVDFIRSDYHNVRMPASSFDLVFGSCVIERGGPGAVFEARRLMRFGGQFMSIELNLRGDMDKAFFEAFPKGYVDRFGLVSRVSIYRATKGK